MAGSIPPLVSSSPPPLSAFDDDEEDEDEFGMYTTAEEMDYNECISFKEKDGVVQSEVEVKSRGEQDSTSQDSATDSGLCPDSEGVSPTPHSDDERTARQSVCDRLCQKPPLLVSPSSNCESEPRKCPDTCPAELDSKSNSDLTNGHVEAEEFDDEFGNFENFECSSATSIRLPVSEEEIVSNKLEPDPRFSEVRESNGFKNTAEETVEEKKNEEVIQNDFSSPVLELESSLDAEPSIDHKHNFQCEFPPLDEEDLSDKQGIQQDSLEVKEEEGNKSEVKTVLENEQQEEKETPQFEEVEDEFEEFTDFKANFSNSLDLPEPEQSTKFSEHSKPFLEQEHLQEAATALQPPEQDESDDEFSNFADFSSSDCAFVSAQSSNSLENVSHIPLRPSDDVDLRTESDFQDWVSAFPCETSDTTSDGDDRAALMKADDGIWMRLFPLESSPALSYQWAESLANRHLLSALNIDSRNIIVAEPAILSTPEFCEELFMPWSNSAVPRFAANLSCGPLQPVKATEPPPQLVPSPAIPPSSLQESVPDAHFDWVSSGLTNPLDSSHSSLLDLNFMVTHLTISPKPVLSLPKTLSMEAESLLASLPDLSFMRKTYIDFPINEG